jgi:DNA-directed DNA polymerase III PolC
MYCHLRTHSCYSFLEGLSSPAALAAAAASAGMPALGLTDHLSLTGALAFYRACREAGVQPVLGLEVDLALPFSLADPPEQPIAGQVALLAMDRSGWRSLCRLSSRLLTAGESGQGSLCSLEDLDRHAPGLLCLTGGRLGAVQRLLAHPDGDEAARDGLSRLAEIFPGRLYVELHHELAGGADHDWRLAELAAQLRLPLVASHAVYYLSPGQADLQRTVTAIRQICPISRLPPEAAASPGSWFLPPDVMAGRFADLPRALEATQEIAGRCALDLALGQPHYPEIPLPAGLTAIDLLRQKAESGARRLYGNLSQALQQRLESELSVIAARGYEPIFLIAEEMLAYARQQGIPSASRGSASSSLVAHCIGITTPDPLALDLYFERFLNPARATPPDIDTDFCSRRRDDVIHHLFETYSPERVAMVATINTFRPRSALSEVAKAHGFAPAEIRALAERVTRRGWGPPGAGPRTAAPPEEPLDPEHPLSGQPVPSPENDLGNPFAGLMAQYGRDPRYAAVFREATALLGLPHHLSVHPGGVVIAPGPLVDFVPVTRSGGKGVTITQFDLDDVEQAGLIKLDLLGIRGLTVLGDVTEQIFTWRRKEFTAPLAVLDGVPLDDPETAGLVAAGKTIGCFQIESPGMRATLRDIQARNPADIMAALALYRPGPLKGGLRDAFVRRYKRLEPVAHIHPALSGLLSETYGVILYQEQVLRIAHELAGLSLAEADLLRRAMSHFDPGRQMQVLKEKFVAGAGQRGAIPAETGARIWDMMAAFAGYGFPKAHAASYAQVAWRSAWCKAHYPAEFIAAVLANWGGYYPQSIYLNEARRMGLRVRPPHVNHARGQFSVSYPHGNPVLYMGLDQVRGLTHRTQERILRLRPFSSLADFLVRVDPRRQEVENLVQAGAFEGLGAIPDLLRELAGGKPRQGQLSLFSFHQVSGEDWTVEQKMEAQQRLLGISLEMHPLELHAQAIARAGALNTVEAAARAGETVRVAGLRQSVLPGQSDNGEPMGFLILEDLEGILDVALSPPVYQRARGALSGAPVPLVVEGPLERDAGTGEPILLAKRVWRLV